MHSAAALKMQLTVFILYPGFFHRLIAISGAAPDAVRDQIIRHNPITRVYAGAYADSNVRFNCQDAFFIKLALKDIQDEH